MTGQTAVTVLSNSAQGLSSAVPVGNSAAQARNAALPCAAQAPSSARTNAEPVRSRALPVCLSPLREA
jgi:hypothetical protein